MEIWGEKKFSIFRHLSVESLSKQSLNPLEIHPIPFDLIPGATHWFERNTIWANSVLSSVTQLRMPKGMDDFGRGDVLIDKDVRPFSVFNPVRRLRGE